MQRYTELFNLLSIDPGMFRFLSGLIFLIVIFLPIAGLYILITRKLNDRGRRSFDRILRLTTLLLLSGFFTEIAIALITQHQVNKRLGFYYSTPELPEGELFLIMKVTPGMPMDKAGLKPGDQVLMNSTMKFYRLLINNQGKEAEFKILRQEEEINIRVIVPEMKLIVLKLLLLF